MLTVLWGTGNPCESEWEYDWLRELLDAAGLQYQIQNLNMSKHIVPNTLIVLNHMIPYMPYLQQYEAQGIPYGVIHLSDERFNANVSFYNHNMCRFVFRNYFTPKYVHPKMTFFALGYKRGFWADARSNPMSYTVSERQYIWSFAGTPKGKRSANMLHFADINPHKVVWEHGDSFHNPKTGLDTIEYRNLMLNSICVLCLEENVITDTFRLCEAFECGCIPIVVNVEYFENLFESKLPCIIGSTSWQENAKKLQSLDMNSLETLRQECYTFWCDYKKNLAHKLALTIKEHIYRITQ